MLRDDLWLFPINATLFTHLVSNWPAGAQLRLLPEVISLYSSFRRGTSAYTEENGVYLRSFQSMKGIRAARLPRVRTSTVMRDRMMTERLREPRYLTYYALLLLGHEWAAFQLPVGL